MKQGTATRGSSENGGMTTCVGRWVLKREAGSGFSFLDATRYPVATDSLQSVTAATTIERLLSFTG